VCCGTTGAVSGGEPYHLGVAWLGEYRTGRKTMLAVAPQPLHILARKARQHDSKRFGSGQIHFNVTSQQAHHDM
jgi:hypothetical protein